MTDQLNKRNAFCTTRSWGLAGICSRFPAVILFCTYSEYVQLVLVLVFISPSLASLFKG